MAQESWSPLHKKKKKVQIHNPTQGWGAQGDQSLTNIRRGVFPNPRHMHTLPRTNQFPFTPLSVKLLEGLGRDKGIFGDTAFSSSPGGLGVLNQPFPDQQIDKTYLPLNLIEGTLVACNPNTPKGNAMKK